MSELEFDNEDDLEVWLRKQPLEVSAQIAIRSSLRVIPYLELGLIENTITNRKELILSILRCTLVANLVSLEKTTSETIPTFDVDELASLVLLTIIIGHSKRLVNTSIQCIADSTSNSINFLMKQDFSSKVEAATTAVIYAAKAIEYDPLILSSIPIWHAVSKDTRAFAHNTNSSSSLWHGDSPHSIIVHWHRLRDALLSVEDEDWAVWTDWYEARLRGDPIDIDLERAKALIPDEIWEQEPKVANAEIRRLIDEHAAKKSKRRLPLTIERTRKLIEQDRLGFAFKPAGDHVTLDASDDPADTRIEKDLAMMRMRADQLCRAFTGANADYQLDRRDEASMFAEILKRPVQEIAENARTLWAISMGMGSAYELDAVERARGGSVLTDHQRSAVYTFLSSSGPFVRLFPGALEMDSENDRHKGVEHRRTLDLKLIEASVTHRILLQADAGILLAIDGIAKAMTAQSPKAANALDASQTNLIRRILLFAAGKAGLVADATLKGMGIDISEHLALGEKAIAFAMTMKDAILSHVETLPADQRAPMKDVIEQLDTMDV